MACPLLIIFIYLLLPLKVATSLGKDVHCTQSITTPQIDRRGASSYVIPNRNDRSATLTTLDDDTSYSLSIVATNNIGSSPRSSTVQFRTWKKPLYLRVWFAGNCCLKSVITIFMMVFFVTTEMTYREEKEILNNFKIGKYDRFSKYNKPIQSLSANSWE